MRIDICIFKHEVKIRKFGVDSIALTTKDERQSIIFMDFTNEEKEILRKMFGKDESK